MCFRFGNDVFTVLQLTCFLFYRIRTDLYGGAWCPESMIDVGSYEWLQIDFPEFQVITMVETQGRFGNGEVI